MAEVVLVRWPEEAAAGAALALEGTPVLYLLGPHDDPPEPTTILEDWVRIPGDDRDLQARVAMLERRVAAHDAIPRLDDAHRLHYRGHVVPLASADARLIGVLIERFGDLVADADLQTDSGASIRGQMTRLRSQMRDIGLDVDRVLRRGYRLQRR
ncbi:MAG TPA: hypothetical protein VHC63_01910 [Acidimicrobiales bacterium]|nr:hypothetical protein [Acidimicrobiales bacterium]